MSCCEWRTNLLVTSYARLCCVYLLEYADIKCVRLPLFRYICDIKVVARHIVSYQTLGITQKY